MRIFSRCLSLVMCTLFCCFFTNLTAQEKSFSKKQGYDLLTKNAAALNLSVEDIKDFIIADAYYDRVAKLQLVYLQQAYKGVPVYNAIRTIAFKNDTVVSFTKAFAGRLSEKVNVPDGIPAITPDMAVSAAASHLSLPLAQKASAIALKDEHGKINYGNLGVARDNITARLLWIPVKNGALVLAWQVKVSPLNSADLWLVNVDAINNTIISKVNLTVYDHLGKPGEAEAPSGGQFNGKAPDQAAGQASTFNDEFTLGTSATSATYRVIPYPAESMKHVGGTPALINNPWDSAINNPATTLGWHDDGTFVHDSTRGNNVWAREDRGANDGVSKPGTAAVSSTPSPQLTFNFPFDPLVQPILTTNQQFAITQLFYLNNVMHDITYQYGFDEHAGNFQNSNFGRGGLGNDYVIADAQDGVGSNNANFSTPDDGSSPRMQMYLFKQGDSIMVNAPASISGPKAFAESGFSVNNKLIDKGPITGDLSLYDPNDPLACNALAGKPLAGKIVLIYAGSCSNINKILNVQNAGAIAVVVINNFSGSPYVMGGSNNSITIPAVMISDLNGSAIRAKLLNGETVNVTLKTGINLDSDLDNGVIAHEYTHGISNRLTGGPSNSSCLVNKEQMGEGWSDYFALMTTTKWSAAQVTDGSKSRPQGTYLKGQDPATGAGIRTYPYSTNLSINPWTYNDLASKTAGEVHAVGEIWAATLWDMTWNIIEMDGINPSLYNPDATGGNSVALKLVIAGMKLQPCSPGFLDGRDAILKADEMLFEGRYSCAIWKAFARRGMGINAKQGSSDSYQDQIADFTPNTAIVKKTVNKAQATANEALTYTLTASCKCGPIANYKIVDTLASNVTYVSGGAYNASNRTVTFTLPSMNANDVQTFTLVVNVNSGSYTATDSALNETVATTSIPSKLFTSATGTGGWAVSNTFSHSAPYALKAADVDKVARQTLTTAAPIAISGVATLSFWHYYNVDESDNGFLEISTDNGATWNNAAPYITQNGYTSTSGYSGNSNQFIKTVVNLSSFNKKSILIRFVFITNADTGGDGWYIDDMLLMNQAGVSNIAQLFNSSNELQNASDTVTMLNSILPLVWGSFTAQKQETTGLLKWTTMQEQNTAEFVVERSSDGIKFQALGSVKASGESSQPVDYSFRDNRPVTGNNYYRIKQVDKDGKFTYSVVRLLNFDLLKGVITITPNPATNKIAITITRNTKTLQAVLVNSAGQTVETFMITGQYAQHNLPGLAAGVYYLNIKGDKISATKKLIIK